MFFPFFLIQILARFVTFFDLDFSSKFSKVPFSQQSHCTIRLKFGVHVCSISRHLMPQTVLRIFDFWKLYDIFGLQKVVVFHLHSKFFIRFSPFLVCKFVYLMGTWCCKQFWKVFRVFENLVIYLDFKIFFIFSLNSQIFHLHSKVFVQFSPNLACKFA